MNVNRLIVEGVDDYHFIANLLYNYSIKFDKKTQYEIKAEKGIYKLFKHLPGELIASDYLSLGIIVDADQDIKSRIDTFNNFLLSNKMERYNSVNNQGFICNYHDNKKIGIWIMPDNQNTGCLENFISSLIDPNDKLWPIANSIVTTVSQTEMRFMPQHTIKAEIHTWLAWQKQPGMRMGQVFESKYINPHSPQAKNFVNWVKRLFGINNAET
jgi:hypothetical protein